MIVLNKRFILLVSACVVACLTAEPSMHSSSAQADLTEIQNHTLEVMDYPEFLQFNDEERVQYFKSLCDTICYALEVQKDQKEVIVTVLQQHPTGTVTFHLKVKQASIPQILAFIKILTDNADAVIHAYVSSPTMGHVAWNVTMALGITTIIKFSGVLITLWHSICDANASVRNLINN